MWVIRRARGEGVCIGDQVRITVVEVLPDKVRLCVEAPSDVSVHRGEILTALRAELGAVDSTNRGPMQPPQND